MTKEQTLALLQFLSKACKEGHTADFSSLDKGRLDHAIATMEEVVAEEKPFDLSSWYNEHHPCGTSACMMGYVAMTPEWHAASGDHFIHENDISLGTLEGYDAAQAWFKTSAMTIQQLIFDAGHALPFRMWCAFYMPPELERLMTHSHVYTGIWAYKKATAKDMLAVLREIKETGQATVYLGIPDYSNLRELFRDKLIPKAGLNDDDYINMFPLHENAT